MSVTASETVVASIMKRLIRIGLSESLLSFNSLGLDAEYQPYFRTAFLWLVAEELVRMDECSPITSKHFSVRNPVLTSKGFAVLGKKMKLNGRMVLAESVIEQKSVGSSSIAAAGDFLGGLLGGFTKSIGS